MQENNQDELSHFAKVRKFNDIIIKSVKECEISGVDVVTVLTLVAIRTAQYENLDKSQYLKTISGFWDRLVD